MELFLGEKVADVVEYEGLYAVTSFGRIWSYPKKGQKGQWLKLNRSKTNYIQVGLTKKGENRKFKYVHQLVAKAFIPNPENKKQVNHMNGNKYDCKLTNLEWVTARENIQHSADMGLNKHYKLSYADKLQICEHRLNGKFSVKEIARMYEVCTTCIYKVLKAYMLEYQQNIPLAA